ncbi:FkbM family methyltransferase [Bordetella avium]|nr:FkbM family methyltransferase [Bordetella avium]
MVGEYNEGRGQRAEGRGQRAEGRGQDEWWARDDAWRESARIGDERLARIQSLDGYYVLWPRYTSDWTLHLHEVLGFVYRDDPRFLGYCVVGDEPSMKGAMVPVMPVQEGGISMMDFLKLRSRNPNIGLVHMSGTVDEWGAWRRFSGLYDFLALMAARDAPHTCGVPIGREREYMLHNLDRYRRLVQGMDALSRNTVAARIRTLLEWDRGFLLQSMMPVETQYFNGSNPQSSFVPRSREVYADIGASQGEVLARMDALLPMDSGSQLWAFEPNRMDYNSLRKLAALVPLKAERVVVGAEQGGSVDFYTNPNYSHGSHFVSPSASPEWRAAHADWIDVLPQVTLDHYIADPITMLKADVEGGELSVLQGATRHLERPQCRLAIAAYHQPEDLLAITDLMSSLGRKRFSVRGHHPTLWDMVLYAHEEEG